jgi:hypothetical protein
MAEHECSGNTCQVCNEEYDADNAAEALGSLLRNPRRTTDQEVLAVLTTHIRNVVRQEIRALSALMWSGN